MHVWGLTPETWAAISAIAAVASALATVFGAVLAAVVAWMIHRQSGPRPSVRVEAVVATRQHSFEDVDLQRHVIYVTVSNTGRTPFNAWKPRFDDELMAPTDNPATKSELLVFEGPDTAEIGPSCTWTCDITHLARMDDLHTPHKARVRLDTTASRHPVMTTVSLNPPAHMVQPTLPTKPHPHP